VVSAPDFREAGHLPKRRRQGEEAANPFDLPRQRRGKTPQMHGRYPDYDVLEQSPHWDEVTRELVEKREREPYEGEEAGGEDPARAVRRREHRP
jgi:hypothetical protein